MRDPSRDNHPHAVVVQDLATQWIQSYPCKTESSHETEKSVRKFLEPSQKKQQLFTLTIHWSLENLVKIYHGIIEHQHLIDPRRMALLKEPYAELRKGLLQYCCNQVWMKNGGRILWNVFPICETFKISYLMGKTPSERRFGKPCEGPSIPFGSLVEYYPILCERPVKNPSIWEDTWIVPRIRSLCGGGGEFGRVTY